MSRRRRVSSLRAYSTSTELRRTACSHHCSTSPSRRSKRVKQTLSIGAELTADEESFLVGYDKHTDELLLAEPLEGMEEELATRMELMCA